MIIKPYIRLFNYFGSGHSGHQPTPMLPQKFSLSPPLKISIQAINLTESSHFLKVFLPYQSLAKTKKTKNNIM